MVVTGDITQVDLPHRESGWWSVRGVEALKGLRSAASPLRMWCATLVRQLVGLNPAGTNAKRPKFSVSGDPHPNPCHRGRM